MLAWQWIPAWSKLAYSYQISKNPVPARDSWSQVCPRFKSKPQVETTSRSLTRSQWCWMTQAMMDSCCSPVLSFKEVSLNKRKRKTSRTKTPWTSRVLKWMPNQSSQSQGQAMYQAWPQSFHQIVSTNETRTILRMTVILTSSSRLFTLTC